MSAGSSAVIEEGGAETGEDGAGAPARVRVAGRGEDAAS